MMVNLFSVFDPSSSVVGLSLNWLSAGAYLLFMPLVFWKLPNRWSSGWVSVMSWLGVELSALLGKGSFLGLFFISLFIFIGFNNVLGLVPYIFTATSHMSMTLALALPLWLGYTIYGWAHNTVHMLAHLVPQGTPPVLMPFMVLIESISSLIRPVTLSVRLAANMIAGHMLIILLSSPCPSLGAVAVVFVLVSQIMLFTLEVAVAFIQGYVFMVLSALYTSEV